MRSSISLPRQSVPQNSSGERTRIKDAIEALAMEPRPQGHIQLSGGAGECRIRIGSYRVVYDIEDDKLVILVLRIGHRREIYR